MYFTMILFAVASVLPIVIISILNLFPRFECTNEIMEDLYGMPFAAAVLGLGVSGIIDVSLNHSELWILIIYYIGIALFMWFGTYTQVHIIGKYIRYISTYGKRQEKKKMQEAEENKRKEAVVRAQESREKWLTGTDVDEMTAYFEDE